MNKKQVAEALSLISDHLTQHKDKSFSLKRTFYYTHGCDSQQIANKVLAEIPTARILEHRECRNTWPKDSYWLVRFIVVAAEPTPQEVNGAYCQPCVDRLPYLSTTGAIQPEDTTKVTVCRAEGCGAVPTVWAVKTVRS